MKTPLTLGVLLASTIIFVGPAQGQDDNHPILKDVLRIQKQVEQLRGLKFQAPVKAGVWKPDRLKKMLLKDFDKEAPAADILKEEKVLKVLGLLPKDFQYRAQMIKFLTDQIGGFYRPDKKELFLVDRSGQPAMGGPAAQKMNDQMVMAHELHHALQDQNFALDRWFEVLGEHNDRIQGYKALVEGEAQLVGMTYIMGTMGRPGMPNMKQMNRMNKMMMKMTPQGRKLAKIPPFLLDNMMFPYTEGSEFVQDMYRKYGWKGISKAFHNPPASTEQVLHPEKYINRDEPQEIRLPNGLKKVLGEKTKELTKNTLGEYSIRILLKAIGVGERQANAAAAGWDGDRYIGFETAKGQVVVLWFTTWDSQAEAQEFEKTYVGALKRPNGYIERRGTEVVMVDGLTGALRTKFVNKAFRSVKVEERWAPTPDMLSKPPRSDFVKGDTTVAAKPKTTPAPSTTPRVTPKVGAKVAPRLRRLDDLGVAFVPPKGFILGTEPIRELTSQFNSAFLAGPDGQKIRLIGLPVPMEIAAKQLEGMIQQGIQGVAIEERTKVKVQGRDAMRVVFTASLPGDKVVTRNTIVVVGMGQTALALGHSQPKTAKAAKAHLVLQKIVDTLWLDRVGAKKGPAFAKSSGSLGKYRFSLPTVLDKGKAGGDPLAHSQTDAAGAKVQVVVQPARTNLEDYASTLEAQLPHLPGGPHITSAGVITRKGRQVHEIEFVRNDRRYRQMTIIRGGKRWTVTVSAPSTKFDSYRNKFGQVLSGFQLERKVKKREVF